MAFTPRRTLRRRSTAWSGLKARGCAGLLALAALTSLYGCRGESGSKGAAGVKHAPNFELNDLSGRRTRLSDFQGKVVLVDFWATYCLPCRDAIPELQELYERYRAEGFEVVGISADAYTELVGEFAAEFEMTYPVLLDPEATAQEQFEVRGLPETFLIGHEGELRDHWFGYNEGLIREIRTAVEAALEEKTT